MTRAEWIQQAVLQAMLSGETASPKETVNTIVKIANVADALEKSSEAPWDNAKETVRESFVRGTEVGHAEAKKICAQILQSNGIGALVHHLGVDAAMPVQAEREASSRDAREREVEYAEDALHWLAEEREACAKLCELYVSDPNDDDPAEREETARDLAARIRARTTPPVPVADATMQADLILGHPFGHFIARFQQSAVTAAVQIEREACAMIAWNEKGGDGVPGAIAAKIRARGTP